MKLTKDKLQKIIKEELSTILKEGDAEIEAELFVDKLQKMSTDERKNMTVEGAKIIFNQLWELGNNAPKMRLGLAAALQNWESHLPREITKDPDVRDVFRSTMDSLAGKGTVTRRSELNPDDPLSTAGRY
jgi:hypothetical protein